MEQIFKDKIKVYEMRYEQIRKEYGHIANLRLIILIVGIYTTYRWFALGQMNIWSLASIIIYAIFFVLIKRHQRLKEEMEEAQALGRVNQKYLDRMGQEWQSFEDDGAELMDVNHPYAFDLDILGPRSLFQKINTTHTWYGRHKLSKDLLNPEYTYEEIQQRQQGIAELINKLDFCQRIEGVKSTKITKSPDKMIDYACSEECITKPWWQIYTPVTGVMTVVTLGASILFEQDILGVLAAILIIVNLGIQYFYILKINEIKGILGSLVYDLTAYSQLLEIIEKETFYTPYLKKQKDILYTEGYSAREALSQLEKICNKANISYQPIAAIVLNAVWVWDLRVLINFEEWRANYGTHLEGYLQAIGEIESLVSLTVLSHIEKDICFPLIEEKGTVIEGVQIGHPLIRKEVRINNDLDMENSVFIITGSNMSGKTTFLRTIGMQLVLAYAGAPTLAKRFRCSRMQLYTSMRIRDDLSEGVSTFYAELTRIKTIVEASKKEKQICFLIDEIFRGTNSVDRIIGAKSVIKGLQKEGAIGAMTTHDLEICQLAYKNQIINYHFTESYSENKIQFDYLIKQGASTTTNAKYLMKMVGIEIME